MNCVVCEKTLTGRQTKFCSKRCNLASGNAVYQSYAAQQRRGWNRKRQFALMLGGRCTACGYSKNLTALEFHHRDGKDFSLDLRSMSNRSEASLLKEVIKCILLCANCHREHHHPEHVEWARQDSNL